MGPNSPHDGPGQPPVSRHASGGKRGWLPRPVRPGQTNPFGKIDVALGLGQTGAASMFCELEVEADGSASVVCSGSVCAAESGAVPGGPSDAMAGGMGELVGPVLKTGGPTVPAPGNSFGQIRNRSPVGSIRGKRQPAQPAVRASNAAQTTIVEFKAAVVGFLPNMVDFVPWNDGYSAKGPDAKVRSPEWLGSCGTAMAESLRGGNCHGIGRNAQNRPQEFLRSNTNMPPG